MDIQERIDSLRSLALVRHLAEPKQEEFARVLDVQQVPAGTYLFEEGSPPGDSMFLLAEGQVRVEKRLETGGVREPALFAPGDVFGEMAIIEGAPRSARAIAETDVILFVLRRASLDRWLQAEPHTAAASSRSSSGSSPTGFATRSGRSCSSTT